MPYTTKYLNPNNPADLRSFIVNLMDGAYHEGDTLEPMATEYEFRDRVLNYEPEA